MAMRASDDMVTYVPQLYRQHKHRINLSISVTPGTGAKVRTLAHPAERQVVWRLVSRRWQAVDFAQTRVHIRPMDFDISHLLEHWEYQPGQVVVRKFKAKDGQEKIQLRVDLGLLQMNAEGRPDGKRPFGYTSLLEYHQARLYKHVAGHEGSDEGFSLKPEECAKLQLEALQYHHRYICLLQLEDYAGVIRDAERNLAVFDFVEKHAESDDLAWSLRQFQPQLLMILTRARGAQALKSDDYTQAFRLIDEGLEQIRAFYREHANTEAAEQSNEILSLEDWLEEVRARRPLSQRERLERALNDAVNSENYEKAAQVRDELKNLKSAE
jgi:hypothetical protein